MIQQMQITDETAWLEKRKGYVTSTEVAALYGENPYITAFELWHIKRGNIQPADISGENFIRFGKLVEPVIAQMILLENPTWKIEPCRVFAFDDVDKIGSSFDYWVTIDGKRGLLEIKSTSYAEYKKKYEDDEAPVHYEIQAQVELELMPEAEFVMQVCFLADTRTLKYIPRQRDTEMGHAMRKAVREFWAITEAPAIDYERDKSVLAKIAPKCDPNRTLDATQDATTTELAAMYKAEKDLEVQSKKNADKFYTMLMERLGDAKYAWTNSHKITVSDVKATEGKLVTPEMVGTYIGARAGFKKLTITETKNKGE